MFITIFKTVLNYFCLLFWFVSFCLFEFIVVIVAVLCSPLLISLVGQPCTKEASPADCSGDDTSVSGLPPAVSGGSASESNFSCRNNVSNLSEDSMACSNHSSQPELIKGRSFDSEILLDLSPALKPMKRADSLPSTLLWYVLISLPCFVFNMYNIQTSFNFWFNVNFVEFALFFLLSWLFLIRFLTSLLVHFCRASVVETTK